MTAAQVIVPLKVSEYLQLEEKSKVKHEFFNGHIHAMVGATRKHNLIAGALFRHVSLHLRGSPCRTYISDMKVRIKTAGEEHFYYPDLMVSCDQEPPSEYYEERPLLLVEVLSDSTEAKDRLEKLAVYMAIPSLQEYMLVSQHKAWVEVYRRMGAQWVLRGYEEDEIISLESVGMNLSLKHIYEDVLGKIL